MADSKRYSLVRDVLLRVEAAVAAPSMRVSDVLALRPGSVIATSLRAGENIRVFAGGACIGAGEYLAGERSASVRMVRFGGSE